MIEGGATHIGVATDHAVESLRNALYPRCKSSEGVPPELLSQFPLLEDALRAMGVLVWPRSITKSTSALAAAAMKAAQDIQVETVFIRTPHKDLAQCATGTRWFSWFAAATSSVMNLEQWRSSG